MNYEIFIIGILLVISFIFFGIISPNSYFSTLFGLIAGASVKLIADGIKGDKK
jgi:hypothetical protein